MTYWLAVHPTRPLSETLQWFPAADCLCFPPGSRLNKGAPQKAADGSFLSSSLCALIRLDAAASSFSCLAERFRPSVNKPIGAICLFSLRGRRWFRAVSRRGDRWTHCLQRQDDVLVDYKCCSRVCGNIFCCLCVCCYHRWRHSELVKVETVWRPVPRSEGKNAFVWGHLECLNIWIFFQNVWDTEW